MRGMAMHSLWKHAAAAGGIGALMIAYGCGGASNTPALRAQELVSQPGAQAGAPVVVSCEPNQRTLVRAAVVNGAAVSQVECVSTGQDAAYAPAAAAVPIGYRYTTPRLVQSAPDGQLADARIIPAASYPVAAARPMRTGQIVYDDRPVRTIKRTRSVKKSAVIIGSSAGVGAGIGAAIGGKKGALIGAVTGGGGAALWDQITRRKN